MISLTCLIAFVFVVFMSILSDKACGFSLSFCPVAFYVAPCKILHLLHIGAAESRCKRSSMLCFIEIFVSITTVLQRDSSIINCSICKNTNDFYDFVAFKIARWVFARNIVARCIATREKKVGSIPIWAHSVMVLYSVIN